VETQRTPKINMYFRRGNPKFLNYAWSLNRVSNCMALDANEVQSLSFSGFINLDCRHVAGLLGEGSALHTAYTGQYGHVKRTLHQHQKCSSNSRTADYFACLTPRVICDQLSTEYASHKHTHHETN